MVWIYDVLLNAKYRFSAKVFFISVVFRAHLNTESFQKLVPCIVIWLVKFINYDQSIGSI